MFYSTAIPLQLITVSLISLQRESTHRAINNANPLRNSYDYIVVGAGSAGAAIAYRLTEDPDINVLLLEAGPANTVISDPPALAIPLWREYPILDWGYQTTPQRHAQALKTPGVLPERRGKVIGGTSSINGLIHVIGNKADFDEWESTYGANGWSYADVLPYFRKLENNTDLALVSQNAGYHGTDGPVFIQSDPNPQKLLQKFQNVFNKFGYKTTDLNGVNQFGTAFTQMSIKDGVRSGSGNAYIDPNRHPNNLFILTDALVTKIRFTRIGEQIVTTGVEYFIDNKKYKVNADIEVIVSAGVFNSPQLLMLSGVGPKEHLQSFGIPLVKDLPVGNNLQDHPKVVFLNVIKEQYQNSIPEEPQLDITQMYDLFTRTTGPLASYSCLYTTHSTKSNDRPEWPNIMLSAFVLKMKNNISEVCAKYGEQSDDWKQYYRPYLGKFHLRTDVNLRRCRSFGTVRLSCADPFERPLIDPNFFADKQDFEDLVESAKFLLYLLQNSEINEYIDLNLKPIPGCSPCLDRPMYACDSYIRCYIKQNGEKELHAVGTCRMGSVERPDVVVDPTLKVKGISRLRVCDASIMPFCPSGNTNTPAVMIGEKCSDLVKEEFYSRRLQRNKSYLF